MNARDWEAERRAKPLLTLASGGWVLLIAFVFALALAVRALVPALQSERWGDREHPESYGFDLSNLTVPADGLEARGMIKDGLRALVLPAMTGADRVQRINEQSHSKYLVSGDRVIGLDLGGERRAYPLRVLNWHEVVNDVVGGVPVAVTYSPQGDAAAVFRRDPGGETLEFGVSGLLYQANLVFHDRREENTRESLWCQLLGRAIAGPLAGRPLEWLPFELTTWADWRERHPDTLVIDPDPDLKKAYYKKEPYRKYLDSGQPVVAVNPAPPLHGPSPMAAILVLPGVNPRVYFADRLCADAGPDGVWTAPDASVRFRCRTFDVEPAPVRTIVPLSADEQDEVPAPALLYCRWFAWFALYPETPVTDPGA